MKYGLSTILLTVVFSCLAENHPKIDPLPYRTDFEGLVVPNIEDFVKGLRRSDPPWGDFLRIPMEIDGEYSLVPLKEVKDQKVEVFKVSNDYVVVLVVGENYRRGFCAALFLIRKNSNQFCISDVIRRTDLGHSYFEDASVLPLLPTDRTHIHITYGRGGRRWMFSYDEFFIVKDGKFHSTLSLKSGCYLQPAHPFREFSQTTAFSHSRDRLTAEVERGWTDERIGEISQKMSITFHWNPKTEKFESSDIAEVDLKEPTPSWSIDGLPLPPGKRNQ